SEAARPPREPGGRHDDRHRGAPAQDPAHPGPGRTGPGRRHPGRVPPADQQLRDDARATCRVGGGGAVALPRRHGPNRRDPDVGEADRLRDDSAERGRGAGPAAGRTSARRTMMAKYLLLKHYRGGPAPLVDVPMDQWTPDEISAHVEYMRDFAERLRETGEF